MNNILKNRMFGYALVVASLIALVLSGLTTYWSDSYAECQSRVSELLIQATDARAEAAERDRQSDREESRATALLIQAVFTGASTAERLTAYEVYRLTMADIDLRREATAKERAAHPIPEAPSQACA